MTKTKNINSNISQDNKTVSRKKIKAGDKEGAFIIQSNGENYTVKSIKEMCVKSYRGNSRKKVDTIDIYIKFENNFTRAYYVVNGKSDGAYIEL